jgi:plasmid stabilization system protein ParE
MAERRIIWSPKAKLDLLEILEFYYKRNGNKTYSIKLNSLIRESIRKLKTHSHIGVNTDIKNVKNLIKGDFLVFYEIKVNQIEILTIWNSNQDPKRLKIKE